MAAPRQQKLADEPCAWCRGSVIGNHCDRRYCSDRCGVAYRLFAYLSSSDSQAGDFRSWEAVYQQLDKLSAAIDADRVREAA
jgi:hypothetical protein